MISSADAAKAISDVRADALVVSTMTPNRYWDVVTTNKERDLPIFGAMGKASSVGLGLALAQPDKKVLILDGDGGLLMNLGVLVTIAGKQPGNLVHFVFEDGVYFTTGAQPIPGAGMFNLAGMAREAGFNEAFEFDNLEDLVTQLPEVMNATGPVFVSLKVNHDNDVPDFYMGNTGQAMRELMAHLQS